MKNPWGVYAVFIPLFTAGLIIVVLTFPQSHRADHPLNRILPLDGKVLGQEPEAWLGEVSGQRTGGRGGQSRPSGMDVDYIKVKGKWYKIKGPIYITKGGTILGWHQETSFEETGYIGRWFSSLE